jgi:O-antigen ligase
VTNATARRRDGVRAPRNRGLLLEGAVATLPAPPAPVALPDKTSFGIPLLSVYVFLLISRILDISPLAFLHLPMILLSGLGLIAVAVGDWKNALHSRVTIFYGMLTGWILLCFPLSSWRGGSVEAVVTSVESFGLYLIMVQLIKTIRDWRHVATAFAIAVLAAAVFSFFSSKSVDGRIALSSGSLGDPNIYALSLVLGLPFWWYRASQAKPIGKTLCLLATIPILVTFGRTGSRAGLIAIAMLVLVIFLFSPIKQKILISGLVAVALAVSAAFLPEYIKARFTTVFQSHSLGALDAQSRMRLGADIDSSAARQALLTQSIQMTFEHPIFGVGPGVFSEMAWNERKAKQQRAGEMLVSHNTFTQMSSEIGIPGFLFFFATFLSSALYSLADFRRLRTADLSLSRASLYTFSSLATLGLGIFFLSVGYSFLLAVIFALPASLHNILLSPSTASSPAEAKLESRVKTPETVLANLWHARSNRQKPQRGGQKIDRRARFGRYVGRG